MAAVVSASPTPSVSVWLAQLQGGDHAAAQPLWERYFQQLVRLARRKLGDAPRRLADEEDVALSAFNSFCRAAEAGRFPRLDDRDNLWRLLATITERKASDHRKHAFRLKRGAGKVRGESVFGRPDGSSNEGIHAAEDVGPTPEEAALLAEELSRLLSQLDDSSLVEVALLKLEGWSNEEIAMRLDRTSRSIERKLQRIRLYWSRDAEP